MYNRFQTYTFILTGSLILIFFTVAFTAFVFLFRERNKRHRANLQRAKENWDRKLMQTKMEVQEQALHFVSMELHDNVIQVISMAKMLLTDALQKSHRQLEQIIQECTEMLGASIKDIKNLSYIFGGREPENFNIVTALERELYLTGSLYKIKCDFICDRTVETAELQPYQVLLIFRIAQEAIHNAARHAEPTVISCNLSLDRNILRLQIEDDGKGFDNRPRNGSGLSNIRERVEMLKGTFRLHSTPGGGCVFMLEMITGNGSPPHSK